METTLRRAKWHPPPPPTPRRARRRQQQQPQKLEALFGQERAFRYDVPPVVLLNSGGRGRGEEWEREREGGDGVWEEKWRFQGDVLRAECKFLRMERQMAVKRLERERVFMDSTLKSALHSLISVSALFFIYRNYDTVINVVLFMYLF